MIKVFIPEIKGKVKTEIRGLWLNDKGKLFYDYLRILDFSIPLNGLNLNEIENIKRYHKQEAVFYTSNNKGYVYYSKDKIDVLNKVKRFNIGKDRANLKGLIKRLLRDYKGLTIYTEPEGYLLEVYYK